MEVSCKLDDGTKVCEIEISTSPCLDLSFENKGKTYKITNVETVTPKDPKEEKSFKCIVAEIAEEVKLG